MIRYAVAGRAIGLALGGCTLPEGDQVSLYDQLGDGDVQVAAATLQRSLEHTANGQSTAWRNTTTTGAAGTITPARKFLAADGVYCRDYDETITIGGR